MGRRRHGDQRVDRERKLVEEIINKLPYNLMSKITTEGVTLYGRVDIVINVSRPILIEVKVEFNDIKTALGQLLFYSSCLANPKLFICCKEEIPKKYLSVLEKYDVYDWRTEGKKYLDLL